jgi:hypothetical protein
MTAPKDQLVHVALDDASNNPIIIGHSRNEIMDCWEVTLTIGNLKSEHQANAVGNKLVKLVERDLGSKRTKAVRPN